MNKNLFYRITPIFGFCLFSLNFLLKLLNPVQRESDSNLFFFFLNPFGIIAFAILMWKPMKFEIYGFFSFIYAIMMLVAKANIILSVSIYMLSISCFYSRGFFNKNRNQKLITMSIIFGLSFMSRIRFGKDVFLSDVLTLLAFLLVLVVAFTVLYPNTIKPAMDALHSTVIDFSKYPLDDKQKKLIKSTLEGKRYREMAEDRICSESVIKKDMQKIFKILDVPDLNGFMAKFGNRKVVGL